MAEDLRRLGAPQETIDAWTEALPIPTVDVLPECRPAVELFLACATQWRVAGMGGATGLDYSAVAVVARALGRRLGARLLDDVQVMEAAVLSVFAAARRP
jgi:hypothetical protein